MPKYSFYSFLKTSLTSLKSHFDPTYHKDSSSALRAPINKFMHPLKNPLQSNLDCFLLEPDSSPCKNNLSCFSSSLELAPFQDWEKIKERYENEQEAYTALILATQIKESCSEDASSKSFDKDLDSLKNLKISGQNFKHDNHEEESQQEPSVSEDDSF